ncbi:hypothetical protein KFE25_011108 [Diacronema lutheri]|uniref:Uncharacterized protein n=1 Tax=Diacronema lutheri TaxID=2081491 RepID=A0A8J5XCQ0_DIALT|nr:hypothetical protein KFE25_011108 [Diacronema lutheri]
MSSSSSSHVDLHKPGGGKNPLPFSSGGGFSGMSSANFRRYWLMRPEVWPLGAAIITGATLMVWGLSREFATNPRYAIAKSRRASHEAAYSADDIERYKATPVVPHPHGPFNLFNMSFRPISELRSDNRAR